MSVRNLAKLFRPRSVALIGASEREASLGRLLLSNLLSGGFSGALFAVNPKRSSVLGLPAYADVASLPETPDLAVIVTPAPSVPALIAELGARGTPAAVVISAGFSGAQGDALRASMLAAAKPHTLRIIGPNCLGVLAPQVGLNASFAQLTPSPGKIAFVAQSGAMITSVLDWAAPRRIGFSLLASLGDMADVDFGDMLDYLADDRDTEAILLYVEAVTAARKFMSAARAAARSKPVIVVKAGRHAAAARAAASHTGALAGSDAVYDAAFRRAGMLRVDTLEELFDAVETLAFARMPRGDRLLIMTNGGGIGVLATDALIESGGTLAELSPAAMQGLDAVLPPTWSRANPVDIVGDAPASRFTAALDILLAEADADALLVLDCPTAVTSSAAAAAAVIEVLPRHSGRTVLTGFVGGVSVEEPRRLLRAAGVPAYESPEDAVTAFMHLVDYGRNQTALLETPPSSSQHFLPDREAARAVIAQALGEQREWLSEIEAKTVCAAYGIPVIETRFVPTADAAGAAAREFSGKCALKVVSHDIVHKSDVGGVMLDLLPHEVADAARAMTRRIADSQPQARLEGFAVQPMAAHADARELIVGMTVDRQFGPVLLFGHGGTAAEVINDKVMMFPPLNLTLALAAMRRTRVSRLLDAYRNVGAVDRDRVAQVLVQVSHMVADLPELLELDINPLLASPATVVALDARMRVATATCRGEERFAIRPYPRELEDSVKLADGRVLALRPIRPDDEPALVRTFSRMDPEEVRMRFFIPRKILDHLTAARFSQIDYDRQMALVVLDGEEIKAVVRLIEDPDRERAEFAIVVERALSGQGLGSELIARLVAYARTRGIGEIWGEVLAENHRMLHLCRDFGFHQQPEFESPGVVRVTLPLGAAPT